MNTIKYLSIFCFILIFSGCNSLFEPTPYYLKSNYGSEYWKNIKVVNLETISQDENKTYSNNEFSNDLKKYLEIKKIDKNTLNFDNEMKFYFPKDLSYRQDFSVIIQNDQYYLFLRQMNVFYPEEKIFKIGKYTKNDKFPFFVIDLGIINNKGIIVVLDIDNDNDTMLLDFQRISFP